jgi:hypothetical protein
MHSTFLPNPVRTGTASCNLQADFEFQTQQKFVLKTQETTTTTKLLEQQKHHPPFSVKGTHTRGASFFSKLKIILAIEGNAPVPGWNAHRYRPQKPLRPPGYIFRDISKCAKDLKRSVLHKITN